jgi:tetratricopeptide (TPR) repeat protein
MASVAFADPNAAAKKHAAELAAEAAQHYRRGELEVSAALLKQAYALYPEPNLLYNLARSLEGVGDKQGAIDAYEKYLETAKQIEDRGAIERRVATLKSELASSAPAPEPTKEPPPPSPEPAASEPTPAPTPAAVSPHDEEEAPSRLPIVTMALGVAIIGGGAGAGVLASRDHDKAAMAATGSDAQSLQNSAHTYATVANVLFIAGGAITVAGLIWEIHEHSAHSGSRVSARAKVGPGAVGLEVNW